jgi:hypothetical protein
MRRRMRNASTALYAVMILGFAIAASAQSPIDQDWTKWSSDVCLKILTDSPWIATAQPQDPKNTRRAVLISSLLVRQAMLRQLQIQQKYDAMSPKKKQEFDDQTSMCLTDPKYTNYIVLRVWGGPPINPTGAAEPGQISISGRAGIIYTDNYDISMTCGSDSFPWQYVPTAIDRFNDDWNNHYPAPLIPPNSRQFARTAAMEFLYPRLVDGRPLFQPGDRTIIINWGEKAGQFTFELADLIYKGKLDF